ncbi:hypothetical protein MMC24_002205 [Lignoscripta atroalba]|nr:hypothetical protein [Lignoscripta atroalba]
MPALTLSSDDLQNTQFSPPHQRDRSISPAGPPYSPITPVLPAATLAPASTGYGQIPASNPVDPPSAVPISEIDNPDAIALRSALSILQMQRQQSLRDLKTLERQKHAAVADPEAFARDVSSGKIKSYPPTGLFGSGQITSDSQQKYWRDDEPHESDDDKMISGNTSEFGRIPGPQNVIRCPPINWAKYHVVGEALDKLHEEQRSRPTPGEPHRDQEPTRASEHVIAAPYRPWTDKLPETPMRTRSVARNGS